MLKKILTMIEDDNRETKVIAGLWKGWAVREKVDWEVKRREGGRKGFRDREWKDGRRCLGMTTRARMEEVRKRCTWRGKILKLHRQVPGLANPQLRYATGTL